MAFCLLACLCVCVCFCVVVFFCLLPIICRRYIVDVLNSIFDDLCIICYIYIFLHMCDRQEFSFSRLYRHILSLTEI